MDMYLELCPIHPTGKKSSKCIQHEYLLWTLEQPKNQNFHHFFFKVIVACLGSEKLKEICLGINSCHCGSIQPENVEIEIKLSRRTDWFSDSWWNGNMRLSPQKRWHEARHQMWVCLFLDESDTILKIIKFPSRASATGAESNLFCLFVCFLFLSNKYGSLFTGRWCQADLLLKNNVETSTPILPQESTFLNNLHKPSMYQA